MWLRSGCAAVAFKSLAVFMALSPQWMPVRTRGQGLRIRCPHAALKAAEAATAGAGQGRSKKNRGNKMAAGRSPRSPTIEAFPHAKRIPMADTFRNYIAGEWTAGPTATANRNPSDVTDVIGEYAQADAAQARTAIAAAKAAFPAWARGSIQERSNILDRAGTEILARKDELGRLLSREEGKTLPEGIGEAMRAGQIFKFFAGEVVRLVGERVPSVRPGVDVEGTREPVGVIG